MAGQGFYKFIYTQRGGRAVNAVHALPVMTKQNSPCVEIYLMLMSEIILPDFIASFQSNFMIFVLNSDTFSSTINVRVINDFSGSIDLMHKRELILNLYSACCFKPQDCAVVLLNNAHRRCHSSSFNVHGRLSICPLKWYHRVAIHLWP